MIGGPAQQGLPFGRNGCRLGKARAARLDEQHRGIGVFGESGGEDGSGGAGADDDEVV